MNPLGRARHRHLAEGTWNGPSTDPERGAIPTIPIEIEVPSGSEILDRAHPFAVQFPARRTIAGKLVTVDQHQKSAVGLPPDVFMDRLKGLRPAHGNAPQRPPDIWFQGGTVAPGIDPFEKVLSVIQFPIQTRLD